MKPDLVSLVAAARAAMPVMMEGCDSPIEEEFLQAYHKVAAEGVSVRGQFQGSSALGGFRLDFAILGPKGQKVGIECDGREFHNLAKDARRDEAIVKSGAVDVIYRLTGADIYRRVYDLLDLLAAVEPWMFSEKGLEVVRGQAAQPHACEDILAILQASDLCASNCPAFSLRNDECGSPQLSPPGRDPHRTSTCGRT